MAERFTFTLEQSDLEALERVRRLRGDRSQAETLRAMIRAASPDGGLGYVVPPVVTFSGAGERHEESGDVAADKRVKIPSDYAEMPVVADPSLGPGEVVLKGRVQTARATPTEDGGYKVQVGPTVPAPGLRLIEKRKGRK